jgi:hypothetical protein
VLEDKHDSIRPRQQLLVRQFVIHHDVNSIEIPSIRAMHHQNSLSEATLQRRESKNACRIPPQDELHQTVAQPANAVIEQDRVRRQFRRGFDSPSIFCHAQHLGSFVAISRT